MSILKSTNSGIYQQISEEFLLENGWKRETIADMEQFGGITVIMRFTYTPTISNNKKEKPLSIEFNNTNLRKFVYSGSYKHLNINFYIETIKDISDLIRYYYLRIDNPYQAHYFLTRNSNVVCSL